MINSYQAERKAIEAHFNDQWQDTCPILFENSRKKLPRTGSCVRFQIVGAEKEQKSIGTEQLHRNIGQVFVQVFVKRGTGLEILTDLVDKAITAFDIVQLDSIQFRAGYEIMVGEIEDDWFQTNVIIPFYRNSIVTKP